MVAMAGGQLTSVQLDAIGYSGGAILAVCLLPQVAKVLITRSARDISIIWSVLYSTGLGLSLTYLIHKDAPAAWIPGIFEVLGCLLVLLLKLFYEYTPAGRRFTAAREHRQQVQLSLAAHDHTAPAPDGALRRQSFSRLFQAAALAVTNSGDLGWRGCSVLGQNQAAPVSPVSPMIDCSVHEGSRRGSRYSGSWHGGRAFSLSAAQAGQLLVGSPAADATAASAVEVDQQGPHANGLVKVSSCRQGREKDPETPEVQVRCLGSAVSSSSSMVQDYDTSRSRAGFSTALLAPVRQQQPPPQPPLEPLSAAMSPPQPSPPVEPKGRPE